MISGKIELYSTCGKKVQKVHLNLKKDFSLQVASTFLYIIFLDILRLHATLAQLLEPLISYV